MGPSTRRSALLRRAGAVVLAAAVTGGSTLALAPAARAGTAADELPRQCVRAATVAASTVTCTFELDRPDYQPFRVPPMVGPLQITAVGGRGGGNPAPRATASVALDVTPGEELQVIVGGDGWNGPGHEEPRPRPDDFRGHGGLNGGGDSEFGYGGGGSSDVRRGEGRPADRVVVAGGSGGSGGTRQSAGGAGGAAGEAGGGGLVGSVPGLPDFAPGGGGAPGTATGGGAGGTSAVCGGRSGSPVEGGAAAYCWFRAASPSGGAGGGGGGGGWFGGGAGGAGPEGSRSPELLDPRTFAGGHGGGGGGSSWAPGGTIGTTSDLRPSVVLRYVEPVLTSVEVASSPTVPAGVAARVRLLGSTATADGYDYTAFSTFRISPAAGGSAEGAACTVGRCWAATPGTYVVTATSGDREASTELKVTAAPTRFVVAPDAVVAGTEVRPRATALDEDGARVGELVGVTYTSDDPAATCGAGGCSSPVARPLVLHSAWRGLAGPDVVVDVRPGPMRTVTEIVITPTTVRVGEQVAVSAKMVDYYGNPGTGVPRGVVGEAGLHCEEATCWAVTAGARRLTVRHDEVRLAAPVVTVLPNPDARVERLSAWGWTQGDNAQVVVSASGTPQGDPRGMVGVHLTSSEPTDQCQGTDVHWWGIEGRCSVLVPGPRTISSSFEGRPGPSTTVVVPPRDAVTVDAAGGAAQRAVAGAAFPTPLVATVRDRYRQPVAGARVTFHVGPDQAGTVRLVGSSATAGDVLTVVTAADGTARAQVRAGALPGAATVTASTPLVARPAAFAMTVEQPSADVSVAVDLPAVLDRHRDTGVRLTVRNAGPSPSGPWTAEVVVPHRLKLRDLGGGTRAGDVVRWSGPSLPSGSSAVRTLTVWPRGKGEVVVTGTASGTLVDLDPTDGTTSARATVR